MFIIIICLICSFLSCLQTPKDQTNINNEHKISLDYIIEQSQSKVENCVYLFINNDY